MGREKDCPGVDSSNRKRERKMGMTDQMASLCGTSREWMRKALADEAARQVFEEARRIARSRFFEETSSLPKARRKTFRIEELAETAQPTASDLVEAMEAFLGEAGLAEGREKKDRAGGEGWVYALFDRKSGRCKIGGTKTDGAREKALAGAHSEKTERLARVRVPNWRETEKKAHERFADRRGNGEWFAVSPKETVDFLTSLPEALETEIFSLVALCRESSAI